MNTHHTFAKILGWVLCCAQLPAQAQSTHSFPPKGSFVLQGKAVHIPADTRSFSLAITNLFHGDSYTVPFQNDGSFQMQLPVAGRQDMHLYLGDAVTLSVCDGDTLQLSFDYAHGPASVRLTGTTPQRTRELELELALVRKFRQPFLALSQEGRRPGALSDTLFLRKIQHYIEGYRDEIQQFEKQHGALSHKEYLLHRGYFDGLTVSSAAMDMRALATLFFQQKIRCFDGEQAEKQPLYQSPDFPFFQSPAAVHFAEAYIHSRVFPLLYMWNDNDTSTKWRRVITLAQHFLPNQSLREWYLVTFFLQELIINQNGKIQELKEPGEQILSMLTLPPMKEKMQQLMNTYFNQMRPGQPATDFTLLNEKGQPVALSSLKGKVVYLDIWAIGCGPCQKEFQLLDKLHQKYAAHEDRIAYVYVCVGSTEKEWKAALRKFGLKGTLLHAPTGKEKGFEAYHGNFFPLYVLIDKEGKIAEYNSPLRPSELLKDEPNLLDRLLK